VLLTALAYLAAVMATLSGVVAISTLLSIAGAPDPFRGFGLPPFMALLVPAVGFFVYLVALVVAAGPALLAVLVTEGLALRQLWLHALIGAGLSAATYAYEMTTGFFGLAGVAIGDVAIMAVGGAIGGLAYWLIAGRRAGIGRS
jgi:hypothetical protein